MCAATRKPFLCASSITAEYTSGLSLGISPPALSSHILTISVLRVAIWRIDTMLRRAVADRLVVITRGNVAQICASGTCPTETELAGGM